jgi:hypothetical protein
VELAYTSRLRQRRSREACGQVSVGTGLPGEIGMKDSPQPFESSGAAALAFPEGQGYYHPRSLRMTNIQASRDPV